MTATQDPAQLAATVEFVNLPLPVRMQLAATVLELATVDYLDDAIDRPESIAWTPIGLRYAADELVSQELHARTAAALTRRLSKIHEANTSDLPAIVEAIMADFDVTPKAGA